MTAQIILNTIALATVTAFTFCFALDLASTLLRAWRAAASAPQLQPETTPVLESQPRIASLNWFQSEEVQETIDEINVVELAKARSPKPLPSIVSLPPTPEAEALEEWLTVAPSPVGKYSSVRPDYTKLTVKQLRQEAKVRNVKNASAKTKKDLIAAILAA